ncbi:MAG TPA: ABC transporter ATP-binding protein [Thermoanaerobaculia bacterium]
MSIDEPAASGPAARARGVGHRFGGAAALAGVDLELPRGGITALVGANGSGKTTLLRILAGILEPSAGEVEVLGIGRPAASDPGTRRALRRRSSYISQDPALDPEMTGGEILSLAAALYGVRRQGRRRRVEELAESFGVASHLARQVGAWSGGLRRRLHLAAGMIHDPELLLLDEPTAGLDPEGRRLLWADLAARAERGRSVAIVTHDLAAAERHAAIVAILDRGTLIAAGSPRDLLALDGGGAADLAEAFRHRTGRDVADLLPRKKGET